MSNEPRSDEARRQSALMARRYAAVHVPTPTGYRWVEPLPDDAPVQDADDDTGRECMLCHGEGVVPVVTTKRHGAVKLIDVNMLVCACQKGRR